MLHIMLRVLGSEHPYLDPGSGSFILQLLLAAILGAGAMIGIYWRKVKTLLVRPKDKEQRNEKTSEDESDLG